jgi:hypothetical protein
LYKKDLTVAQSFTLLRSGLLPSSLTFGLASFGLGLSLGHFGENSLVLLGSFRFVRATKGYCQA